MRDPFDLKEIEWTLWCTLHPECDNCKKSLDLASLDDYPKPKDWAAAVAPTVKALGWSAPGEWVLWCDQCTDSAITKGEELMPRDNEHTPDPNAADGLASKISDGG